MSLESAVRLIASMTLLLLASPALADDSTGADVWNAKCATCHGSTGAGDGPAAGALPRKPRDFTDAAFWDGTTDAAIRATITKGKPGTAMRAFPMKDAQLDALMAYIKTFQPKG